jgi:hypothetical protein
MTLNKGIIELSVEIKTSDILKEVRNVDEVLTPLGKQVYAKLGIIPKEWLENKSGK